MTTPAPCPHCAERIAELEDKIERLRVVYDSADKRARGWSRLADELEARVQELEAVT
jgi:phage shock protein A